MFPLALSVQCKTPVQGGRAVGVGAGKKDMVVQSPRLVDPSGAEEPETGPGSTAGPRAAREGCAYGRPGRVEGDADASGERRGTRQ